MRPEDIQCDCEICQQWRAENTPRTYEQGFRDGMSMDSKWPMTFQFMGYSMQQIIQIIGEHEARKFYADDQWTEADMEKMKERQNKVNEARQKREEFRAFLTAKWGSAAQVESSEIMKHYDAVHCPELVEKPAFEIRNDLKGIDIKVWADGRIEGVTGTLINRIPQLIAKAKQK